MIQVQLRTIFLYLVLIPISFPSLSQINLVPNPSFEDTIQCPNSGGQVSRARYWETIANTPDFFHSCNPYWQFSVPQNTWGFQWPNTGEAYMGLADYISTPGNPVDSFFREVIGTSLTAPLIIGEKYFVNIKVCLSFNPSYYNWVANNRLGILFSTFNYLNDTISEINFCQVYSDSIIRDSINWTTIRGSFIADSAYTFISISNFFMNYLIDTIHLLNSANNSYAGYYYIDDVCVTTDSIYSELWTTLADDELKSSISIFPNPVSNQVCIYNIPSNCKHIALFNLEGKLLDTVNLNSNSRNIIDVSSLSTGLYSLVFEMENSVLVKKFIKSFNKNLKNE